VMPMYVVAKSAKFRMRKTIVRILMVLVGFNPGRHVVH
jgi:hypothetical protein